MSEPSTQWRTQAAGGGRVEVMFRLSASSCYNHKLDGQGVSRSGGRVKNVNYPHLLLNMMYHTL